jgi:Tfp pilus assembly protein PilF
VAQPLLETAVKQAPTNQAYLYHLGLTYQKLNDAARARAELEKAIHQDPGSPTAEQARQALNQTGGTN